jgi:hypothetical protein
MLSKRVERPNVNKLPHRKPTEGRDYWVYDGVLPDPDAVRARLLARKDWVFGAPYRDEGWPGMRAVPALSPEELELVEARVRASTGAKRLWQEKVAEGAKLDHNCVQIVGPGESGPKPHTDSRTLCRFAAVLYLSRNAPASGGTSFYRVRMPNGQLGGNVVPPPHANLVEALGTRYVPGDLFVEDLRVDNRFNRLLLYRADLIHSATGYFGTTIGTKRMTCVFFWMA